VTEADVVGVLGEAFGRKVWSHKQEEWMIPGFGLFATPNIFVFHVLHHAALRYDYLWVFEDDVAWTGNLFDYFRLFEQRQDDILASGIALSSVGDYWSWSRMQSADGWAGGNGAQISKSLIFLQRLSATLLDLMVDHCRLGHWAFDEWFAPTVCMQSEHHLGTHFRKRNCTAADVWHVNGEYALGLLPVYSTAMWGTSYDRATWNASTWHSLSQTEELRLFHPVKF